MEKASYLYEIVRNGFVYHFVYVNQCTPPLKVKFRKLRSPSQPGLGAPRCRSPRRAILLYPAAAAIDSGQAWRNSWLAWLA